MLSKSPRYDIDKIKFATAAPTFEKAIGLYESGKVTKFEEGIGTYSAVVLGTKPYRVSVEARRSDTGRTLPIRLFGIRPIWGASKF